MVLKQALYGQHSTRIQPGIFHFFFASSQFIAGLIAGVVILRSDVAPKWAGLALIPGVISLITGQLFLYKTAIFWPLANARWIAGVWGLTRRTKD